MYIMKKIYQNPSTQVVELNGGALCQSLIIGSTKSEGDGTDLVKEGHNSWEDIWTDASPSSGKWDE